MTHSKIIGLILRGKTLDKKDWLDIIEARKDFLMECIADFSQRRLGDVDHWRGRLDMSGKVEKNVLPLNFSSEDPAKLNCSTKGVFVFMPQTYYEDVGDHLGLTRLAIYGFTEQGRWTVAQIEFRLERGAEALKSLSLSYMDPSRFLFDYGLEAKEILAMLSRVIEDNHQHCRKRLQQAEEMALFTQLEDELLGSK